MKIIIRLLVFSMIAPLAIVAQDANKAGTSAGQFLKIGAGARAMGMAGATVGITDDPSAMYWNPSAMVRLQSFQLYATHTNWFADLSHQFVGVVMPIGDDHRIGVNATILDLGEMEITTELQPRGTGDHFKASNVAVGISYAAQLVDFFSFGLTVKYVTENIYNESAAAVALDVGTTLHTGYNGITVGMSLTNFGSPMKLEGRDLHRTFDPNPNNATNTGVSSNLATESWELPLNIRVGIGWDLIGNTNAMLMSEDNALKFAVDANHPNDGPENAVMGIEYSWQGLLALRSGYHFNDDVRSWSYGLGVQWHSSSSFMFGLDYAFSDLENLGAVHVFSLTLGF